MDKFETQKRIFTINAVLLLLSCVSLMVVIVGTLRETNSGSVPRQAASATAVGAGIHFLIFVAFLIGIRLAKLKRRINKEINLATAIVLFILGSMILDAATASLGHRLLASIGFFACVFCDFAAVIVSVASLFILRPKKNIQPD